MTTDSITHLSNQAQQQYQNGNYQQAAQLFEQAGQALEEQGDLVMAAEMRNNQSVAHLQAGSGSAALSCIENTPSIFAQAGDARREAMAWGNCAAALEALHENQKAIEYYQKAADLFIETGEDEMRATVLKSIGALQLKTGNPTEALINLQSGLDAHTQPTFKQRILQKLAHLPFKLLNR